MLHQIQNIIIFDFFYADHSILKPGIATQDNILNFVLAAIQQTSKSFVGRGNTRKDTTVAPENHTITPAWVTYNPVLLNGPNGMFSTLKFYF